MVVTEFPEEPIVDFDALNGVLTLSLRREAHVPVAVIKAFWKMALSVLPEEELVNFKELLLAVNRDPFESLGAGAGIVRTFYPGPSRTSPRIAILRRKLESDIYPYAFFILHFGNATYQVPLPTSFDPKSFEIYYFQFDDAPKTEHYGLAFHEILDLSSTTVTREPFIGRLKMDR